MIQALYIFNCESKDLIYNKNFQSDEKLEMFDSFFSALQTFVSELTESTTESLNTIELGAYFVLITRISEIISDLVIITDKDDIKEVQKLIPKISEIIINYQELFINWDRKPEKLEMFDLKIIKLILSDKKLIAGSSLTADQSTILKSIWEQKGSLSDQLREDLLKERDKLVSQYLNEENFIQKHEISKKLIKISEKLHDDEKFIEYQTESKSLRDEIKDRKLRLHYYLDRIKESLEYAKYAETYSYLYSFCIKLENFIDPTLILKYKTLAKSLLNRDKMPKDEFKQSIQEISLIEQEINEHLSLGS
ncbi:MAG: hypothetical protein ACFFAB_14075 [Candidatus Heimdallarchaeota archaeon]